MKNISSNSKRNNNLLTLLFLLMIFSMYLVLNFQSSVKLFNDLNVLSTSRPVYSIIIVPLAMGIALLYCARKASNKPLRCIYLSSILPFIVSPDIFSFYNNHLLILVMNMVLTFLLILLIIRYIIKNYRVAGRSEGAD